MSTLFADISEFQNPVDDTYPYEILSIRVCDGTYQDKHFAQNFAWMRNALDTGRLTMGIVYTYVRPQDWYANAQTAQAMVNAAGGMHPRMVWMLDVERGGNQCVDQSGPINSLHGILTKTGKVIGYGNMSDLDTMWCDKPPGIRLIVADYGDTPNYPGQIAHQYTDGTGYGSPQLPQGCPPFGSCDMNRANGSPAQFASQLGIVVDSQIQEIWDQLRGPCGNGWPQLGGHSLVDAVALIGQKLGIEGFAPPKG